METKDLKTRSAFRRSLMTFVIAATPVVAVASFSGAASAGPGPAYVVTWDCTGDFDPMITVQINTDANAKISIYIRPDSAAAWADNFDMRVVGNTDYDDQNPFEFTADGAPNPIAVGSYDVKIVAGNGKGDATALHEATVLVGGCAEIDFPGVVDEFVSIDCDSEPVSILVTLPRRDPPSAKGPKYTVYVYEEEAKGFDEESDPLDQGGSDTFDTGEGTFIIEIYLPNEDVPVYENEITVDCTIPRNPGGGYNFNFKLPKATTAPVLPNTGSESNSLLAVAPLMVLLGGALIVARRRLANA